MSQPTNRLADATSPYLQQHAHNPVGWWPWCEEALQEARDTGRPILLSIGYSACHWCHVMAHESFEDPDTAEVMNRLFVNIKVDREERPDLDKIYQAAHQLLSGRPGGWPLTVFLTPEDQVPFFAGTYFPGEPRHGLPSFRDLLERVARAYQAQQDDIREQNRSLVQALESLSPSGTAPDRLDARPLDGARQQLGQAYDRTHGGFGQAPKFPHATGIERLLRHWAATGDTPALQMAVESLKRMSLGGLYDQLGGGFCRYSVDDRWMIPHFEKMLYDNGPLLALLSDAWQATGLELFRRTAASTSGWVMREMQSPQGGYYSTLDADSEGAEGRFYVWDRAEVAGLLNDDGYALLARHYGLDRSPNFEGLWHLHTFVGVEELARERGLAPAEVQQRLDAARERLFEARERRVRPGRDEKILTSWNALMIKGMARAARLLGREDWLASAERALGFIRGRLRVDGRLLATHKDGRSRLTAYLDDYAFLLDALLELLEARWSADDLSLACELADAMLEHFEDRDQGGFFFTADDHESLIQRPKVLGDESTPAGNGVAAFALQRLGHLLGQSRYLAASERTLRHAWSQLAQIPYAHASLLQALEEYLEPPEILILRGEGSELERWQRTATSAYAPSRMTLAVPSDAAGLPEALAGKPARGETLAYVCRGMQCDAPLTDHDALSAHIEAGRRSAA
ncbi:MAG: thioredoxin domain-containing protein [Chromatiales bacterium]|jgi:uncharacterized protein YyaL (SSP411 family)